MIAQDRVGAAARIFCIAAVLGLSLALFDSVALQGTLFLTALAALAIAADASARLPDRWIVMTEAGLAALIVGMALPQGILLLPYLVVPAMVAGVTLGLWSVFMAVGLEVVALTAVVVVSGQTAGFDTLSQVVGPWLLTTLGVGLLGARFRSLRGGPTSFQDASYESARRLLTQLRTVARRLSSGLDTVTLASDLLGTVHQHLSDSRAGVFTRTDGGVLVPLGFRGPGAKETLEGDGELVQRCWHEMEPVHGVQAAGRAEHRHRIVLPLRVGSRQIGVVVVDAASAPPPKALKPLMYEVDEHALRLDAALAFDDIRSLATIQERHRLAREIHDGVAQEIASLGYAVDELIVGELSDGRLRKLNDLRREISRVVSELRLSIFDLRTEVSAGLGSALSDYVREVGSRSGMTVHTTLDVSPARLRGDVEMELFRIAQEAITNARKHSAARNLWVDCRIRPPFASITVRDDGNGLGPPRADSFGIKVMHERAERINATLEIVHDASDLNSVGTRVTVTVGADSLPTASRFQHERSSGV